ncbi:MAG: polyphosphate kinase 2 family protein [Pseudomonadota bacterium]|nr:polyphosphate kinase 2 family protein [Pseudomonadota bacterium]
MNPKADIARSLDLPAKQVRKLLDRFRVTSGKDFRLKDYDPADTAGIPIAKERANALLDGGVVRLSQLQTKLYAQDRWAMLCVFQGLDAGGKDGTIKHVMTGVNPAGVQVTSFKEPGPEELSHDFLWRVVRKLPERGQLGIFNRSHYEEVLVVRVHPDLLQSERLPHALIGKKIWDQRLQAIANFEEYLARQGTVVVKFFLHLSKEEQRQRFLSRLEEPDKNWKFSRSDLSERAFWDAYQDAYQEAIAATAAPHAPWFIVPADHKWFAHLVVVAAMIEALDTLDLHFPDVDAEQGAALAAARVKLEGEKK